MNLTFYSTSSEVNSVDKSISEVVQLTGFLREQSTVVNPVITVDGLSTYLGSVNYAYIQEFNRYYFITGIESVSTDLWRVSFHVDVLYTYKDAIRSNYGIVARNENQYDLKLNDGLFHTQQNPRIAQFTFPAGFTTQDFVLAIAGNS